MSESPLLALAVVDAVVKWLLVVGGAVVGGLLIGFGSNMATRLATAKPMPRWGSTTTRITGGALCGYLIYLWNPVIGPGGSGDNGNTEKKPDYVSVEKKDEKKPPPDEKKQEKKTETPPDPNKEVVVRIEVLGPKAVEVLKPKSEGTIYRLDDGASKQLFDLAAIRDRLLRLKGQHPKLKVELIQYQDSPAKDTGVFGRLVDLLRERELPYDVIERGEESPEARGVGK